MREWLIGLLKLPSLISIMNYVSFLYQNSLASSLELSNPDFPFPKILSPSLVLCSLCQKHISNLLSSVFKLCINSNLDLATPRQVTGAIEVVLLLPIQQHSQHLKGNEPPILELIYFAPQSTLPSRN